MLDRDPAVLEGRDVAGDTASSTESETVIAGKKG